MEVTQEWIGRLRASLESELPEVEITNMEVLSAFDRAALATVLNGSGAAQENRYTARARKAAATRKKNKLKKEEGNASTAGDQ